MTQLEQKIRELVPETMVFKFGCRIKTRHYNNTLRELVIVRKYVKEEPHSNNYRGNRQHFYYRVSKQTRDIAERDIKEILGSPITLSVVLLAIDRNLVPEGLYPWKEKQEVYYKIASKWNKKTDDLTLQSEEVKELIAKELGI